MRAIELSNSELEDFTNELIAQSHKIRKTLAEIAIYSNGSIRLEDVYNMPIDQIKVLEELITNKIKVENNIKTPQML